MKLVPGTYDYVVRAEGYGMHRFTRTLRAGHDVVLSVELPSPPTRPTRGSAGG